MQFLLWERTKPASFPSGFLTISDALFGCAEMPWIGWHIPPTCMHNIYEKQFMLQGTAEKAEHLAGAVDVELSVAYMVDK